MRVPLLPAAPAIAFVVAGLLLAACGGEAAPALAPTPAGSAATATTEPAPSVSTQGGSTPAPAPTGGTGSASPAVLPPADPASVKSVRERIDATSLDDPASVDALGAVRFDDGAPEAAAAALAEGVTGDQRWAAAWTYASSGTDPEVLRPLLADEDPSLRALAGAALTAWGDPAGIPVLVGLAGLPDRLAGSYPPSTVGDFAAGTLERFVAGPPIEAGASPADHAAAWGSWLTAHDPATLVFDPESGTWSAS